MAFFAAFFNDVLDYVEVAEGFCAEEPDLSVCTEVFVSKGYELVGCVCGHVFAGLFFIEFIDKAVFALKVTFTSSPHCEFSEFKLCVIQWLSSSFFVF